MTAHLIVTDLDGTLLGADHALADVTVDTLRALAGQGHHIVLASGRHYRDILAFRDRLGVEAHIISTNGAYTHAPDGRLLEARPLPTELARELIRLPRPEAVRLNLYHDDEWLIDAPALSCWPCMHIPASAIGWPTSKAGWRGRRQGALHR